MVVKAVERGYNDYGWLKANYSFSFAGYYNLERINFGALRVLNDDSIQGGKGFDKHPHDNMEIITIPLKGSLAHKDSMSDKWIALDSGEVQVMTAGKGIIHAEKNYSEVDPLHLFQIWIYPDKQNVIPSYDQMKFKKEEREDNLQVLVTSNEDKETKSLKIHQNAKISRIDLSKGNSFHYHLISKNHGVYIMVISGKVKINTIELQKRDALGIYETTDFLLHSKQSAEVLFIEVPMEF